MHVRASVSAMVRSMLDVANDVGENACICNKMNFSHLRYFIGQTFVISPSWIRFDEDIKPVRISMTATVPPE